MILILDEGSQLAQPYRLGGINTALTSTAATPGVLARSTSFGPYVSFLRNGVGSKNLFLKTSPTSRAIPNDLFLSWSASADAGPARSHQALEFFTCCTSRGGRGCGKPLTRDRTQPLPSLLTSPTAGADYPPLGTCFPGQVAEAEAPRQIGCRDAAPPAPPLPPRLSPPPPPSLSPPPPRWPPPRTPPSPRLPPPPTSIVTIGPHCHHVGGR